MFRAIHHFALGRFVPTGCFSLSSVSLLRCLICIFPLLQFSLLSTPYTIPTLNLNIQRSSPNNTSFHIPTSLNQLSELLIHLRVFYERSGKNLFWSIKISGEVLNKLKLRGFRATSVSTYFSTLHTTLLHNLIKEKLIN